MIQVDNINTEDLIVITNVAVKMDRSIKNKIVVVTGGARGLGLDMVKKFLDNAAKVVIIPDLNEQTGTDAIKDLTEKYGPGRAVFIKCDVTSHLEATYKQIIDEYKTVDILINNAGVLYEKSIRKTMEVNAIALMEWTAKFYDFMRKDRGGCGGTIINVSSIFGYRIVAHSPSYIASKFAVLGFSKSMGHDYNYKKTGVRVLALCPGLTHTELAGNPSARDDDSLPDLLEELKGYEFQEVDAIGKGVIEIYQKADSGTAWVVEGSRSPVKV